MTVDEAAVGREARSALVPPIVGVLAWGLTMFCLSQLLAGAK